MRFLPVAALALFATASRAGAVTGIPSEKTDALQALIDSKVSDAGAPGAILAVDTSSGTWVGAAGKADLSTGEALSPGMQIRLASVTKTFTAALIMRLVELGKLSLDDTVERWLPGQVTGGGQVSIRMLLNHTSGIYDHEHSVPLFWNILLADPTREWTAGEILSISNAHGFNFPPGTRHDYCNTGYYILGMIAEAAMPGQSVADLASALLFAPAGMTRTALTVDGTLSAPYAHGYSWLPTTRADTDTTGWSMSWDITAGAGVSTGDDMLAWVRALFGGGIVSQSSLDQMEAATAVSPDYGFGMTRYPAAYFGESALGHEGANPGTNTIWIHFPGSERTIFIGLNRNDTVTVATETPHFNTEDVLIPVLSGAKRILDPLSAPALSGGAVSSGSIRWSWSLPSGAAQSFVLHASTGGAVAALGGGATFYLETGLAPAASYSRYLAAKDSVSLFFSSTKAVATPEVGSCISGTSSSTLTGSDGKTQLDIPPALLGAATGWMLSESPLQRPLTGNTTALIVAAVAPAGLRQSTGSLTEFIIAVDGVRCNGTFALPVTVRVPYSDVNNTGFVDGTSPPVRADTLQLYTLNETSGLWEAVPGSTVDTVNKVVVGQLSHLSIFTAFGAGAVSGLSTLRVYPVPYRPNGGNADQGKPYSAADPNSGIIFDNLPQSVSIRIYTLTGSLVTSFSSEDSSGKLRWDARNDSGQEVATGGYLAVITSPGASKVVKKILVVR
ncbi:MAG: serine hydrolase [Elusimicrobia bacterium]|nr:serine hydrolase [Elusimicrobiota bacterium]